MSNIQKYKCHKCSEKATLHITEVEDDGFREVHLCHKCANDYLSEGLDSSPTPPESTAAGADPPVPDTGKRCPICNASYTEFRSSGRLGCPHDYEFFREELLTLLENIHDAAKHIGKIPRRLPKGSQQLVQAIQLRQQLQQAIAVEDYEKAARLRDEINKLDTAK